MKPTEHDLVESRRALHAAASALETLSPTDALAALAALACIHRLWSSAAALVKIAQTDAIGGEISALAKLASWVNHAFGPNCADRIIGDPRPLSGDAAAIVRECLRYVAGQYEGREDKTGELADIRDVLSAMEAP